jgi:D-glycerate 3-kinase
MQPVADCYKKVSKECFKFIKSQETSKEKFKNKEKMIRSFLIPISFWISNKAKKSKPYLIGLAGGQGTGKTTISSILNIILTKYFKLNVFKISIDDLYKTRKDRIKLSKTTHPFLKTRGVPGTHDINFMFDFLKKIKSKGFNQHRLPKFNKAIDDRLKKKSWYLVKKVPDVIIFEGWCVGARAEKQTTLKKSINSLERKEDKNLKWRKFVNNQLEKKYKKLFSKLDCLLFLKARNFKLLQTWRLKQEELLKLNSKNKANNKVMDKNEVLKFMQTYQRVTQNMFKFAPKYSSIVLNLNRNHQIKSIKYNK